MESNHGSTWPEQAKRHPNHVEIGAQPSTEELVNYLHKLACVSWLSDEACSTIERAAARLSALSGERGISVACGCMVESNDRRTWIVFLRRSGENVMDSYQVYSDEIEGRAQYEAAKMRHFLGQGPEPDILDFDTEAKNPPLGEQNNAATAATSALPVEGNATQTHERSFPPAKA